MSSLITLNGLHVMRKAIEAVFAEFVRCFRNRKEFLFIALHCETVVGTCQQLENIVL